MSEGAYRFEIEVGLPDAEGTQAGTTVPYRILVVADFAGSPEGSVSGPVGAGVVDVTADNFDEVMAGAAPSVSLRTTDPTLPGNVLVELPLRFDSLRAFTPANLIDQIPEAKSLIGIREQLVARMRGKLTADQLTRAVAAPAAANDKLAWLAEALKWAPAPSSAASANMVDDLLASIDVGDAEAVAPAPPPKTPIGSIVSAVAAGQGIPAEEASAIRRSLAETDRRISAWVTTVLHAPTVQAIEAAWRSLAFLVSHTDFRKGVRISLLHAPHDQIADRFRSLLIDPVFDRGAPAPDLIVADYLFGNNAADLEALDEFAQHGASLPAVVLAGVSPGFLGVKHAWQVSTLPAIIAMFDQWQFAKWKSLRAEPYARSLGVVFGRCLLRVPHGGEETADLQFSYHEECVSEKDLIWAGGAIAAACAVSRSVCDTGWPTAMTGYVHGRVDGFATAQGGPKGDKKFGPTDTQIPQPKIEELAAAGINAVVGLRDHDDAIVWNGLTAARPRKTESQAFLEVSLPYQLFAARLSALLFAIKPHLTAMAADRAAAFVKAHVCDWLKLEGEPAPEQLSVLIRPLEDSPSVLQVAVTVTPPARILPGDIPVVLGYRLT
jgi:type VI secretion system protein ImpC